MNKRPTSITVISWIMIVYCLLILPVFLLTMNKPGLIKIMAKRQAPVPVQQVLIIAEILVSIVSGSFMLRGANWARWLYIGFGGVLLVFNLATSPARLMIIPSLICYAIILFFLLRPAANAYFSSSGPQPMLTLRRNLDRSTWRHVLAIIFFVISGFFLCISQVFAFFRFPDHPFLPLIIAEIFLALGFVTMFVGHALFGFRPWKKITGIVFLSTSGVCAFLYLTHLCIYFSREIKPMMNHRKDPSAMITNFYVGGLIFVMFLIGGLILTFCTPKQIDA
jgi:hypothetical protein